MSTISLAKSATPRILPDLTQSSNPLVNKTQDELIAIIEALAAKAKSPTAITCKVSERGALCIYGLGRFPVTLYISQFEKLDAHWELVRAFAKANAPAFTRKPG